MDLGRTNGRFELDRDGVVYFHKPFRKFLDRFTLLSPHGVILGQIHLRVILVFPFVFEGIFKGLIFLIGVI